MYLKQLIAITFIKSLTLASSGILNVGFDIDDTILFSRDVFQNIPENKKTRSIIVGLMNKTKNYQFYRTNSKTYKLFFKMDITFFL